MKDSLVIKKGEKEILSSVISAALCNFARKVDWWAQTLK